MLFLSAFRNFVLVDFDSVHPPPTFLLGAGGRGRGRRGEGGEPPTKFSKSGGLAGPKFLERVAGKEEGDFFQGGCSFYIKNELKSKIFNDKKSL